MDVNVTQLCTPNGSTTDCVYSGRIDNVQVSIPMLEAMGLITLWIAICFLVALLINRFA